MPLIEFIFMQSAVMIAIILVSVWRTEAVKRELSNAQWRLDRLQDDNARLRDELAKARSETWEHSMYDEDDEDEIGNEINGGNDDPAERPVA